MILLHKFLQKYTNFWYNGFILNQIVILNQIRKKPCQSVMLVLCHCCPLMA
ncbi:hypothetical protein [Moraxella lacunata]|uniref:hypothetical protein n=1 Tax=Moraxella lacunata TaxID=477 RepID=UPI003EDF4A4C